MDCKKKLHTGLISDYSRLHLGRGCGLFLRKFKNTAL